MKISEVMTTRRRDGQRRPDRARGGQLHAPRRCRLDSRCDGDRLIGMITDRDIAVRGVAEGRGPDTPVSDLMSDGIICARDDDDVEDVATQMSEEQVRRLPVLDRRRQAVRDRQPRRPRPRNRRRTRPPSARRRQPARRPAPAVDESELRRRPELATLRRLR